jgi:hypothetical protein
MNLKSELIAIKRRLSDSQVMELLEILETERDRRLKAESTSAQSSSVNQ